MFNQINTYRKGTNPGYRNLGITIGKVLDTDDPLQAGRLRVFCAVYGDQADHLVEEIPWAGYISAFGGTSIAEARGANGSQSNGGISYGFHSIPQVGSHVAVLCMDGDPNHRFWFGSVVIPNESNTGPSGRYLVPGPGVPNATGSIDGPFSNNESPIEPMYSNLQKAYSKTNPRIPDTPKKGHAVAYEWMSRALDFPASAINKANHDNLHSFHNAPDDTTAKIPTPGGGTRPYTPGYARSLLENVTGPTGLMLNSSVYFWSTPGFHAISMDDRPENCRMRFRTASGSQILMDDTNERIYICTAQGNNWIELDQNGTIDIYSSNRISISSDSDINFHADGSIRMSAVQGIHMTSEAEIRINSDSDTSITAEGLLRLHASTDIRAEAGSGVHCTAGTTLHLKSEGNMNFQSGAETRTTAASTISVGSGAEIHMTGTKIHNNGPAASAAEAAVPANTKQAWLPNRIPEHEPWPRSMFKGTDNDGQYATKDPNRSANGPNNTANKQEPEFSYDSANIGKGDLGVKYTRGPFWSR